MTAEQVEKLRREHEQVTEALMHEKRPAELKKLNRRHLELARILDKIEQRERAVSELEENKKLAKIDTDAELQQLAREESEKLTKLITRLDEDIKKLLIPHDPLDDGDAILEIRAGTGGEEAAIFASELLRMYVRFAERQGWKTVVESTSRTDLGGIKEAILTVKGPGAYGKLKYEGGVHRVQRVPETEKSGRIHTSTASVAVLPLVTEQEFDLDPKDVKVETSTARGHGGQSVNTTYSAVRLTHIPSGITAQSQDERSQAQNREKAWRVLRARVAAALAEERDKEMRDARRSQIKGAERSDKIRTYNFPQDRVTDHRINQNFSQIPSILDGDIADIIRQLQELDEKEKLEKLEKSA